LLIQRRRYRRIWKRTSLNLDGAKLRCLLARDLELRVSGKGEGNRGHSRKPH
jgi:hypothetical protein